MVSGSSTKGINVIGSRTGTDGHVGIYSEAIGIAADGKGTSATSYGVVAECLTAAVCTSLAALDGNVQIRGPNFIASPATAVAFFAIDNPYTNGKPTAHLFVQHVARFPGDDLKTAVGVFDDSAAKWEIYAENNSIMPAGTTFNVLVLNP